MDDYRLLSQSRHFFVYNFKKKPLDKHKECLATER